MKQSKYLCIALAVFFSACRFQVPTLPDSDQFREASPAEKVVILEAFRAGQSQVQSYRGRNKLLVEHSLGSDNLSQVVVLEAPENVRMEFFATGFNRLVAYLILRGGFLHAYDAVEHRVYRGNPSRENIESLISFPLSSKELVLWFLGRAPIDLEDLCQELELHVKRDLQAVRVVCVGEHDRIFRMESKADIKALRTASEGGGSVSALVVDFLSIEQSDGGVKMVSRFEYNSQPEEIDAPSSIALWLPEPELKIDLKVISSDLNPDLKNIRDRLFTGRTPGGGAKIFELGTGNPEDIQPLY